MKNEIILTKEEERKYKEFLYNGIKIAISNNDTILLKELNPKKNDDLDTLKEKYFKWVDNCFNGYLEEREFVKGGIYEDPNVELRTYYTWIVQEYDKYKKSYEYEDKNNYDDNYDDYQ